MKAAYLDYASLDQQDLDFQALHAVFDQLVLYPATSATQIQSVWPMSMSSLPTKS